MVKDAERTNKKIRQLKNLRNIITAIFIGMVLYGFFISDSTFDTFCGGFGLGVVVMTYLITLIEKKEVKIKHGKS